MDATQAPTPAPRGRWATLLIALTGRRLAVTALAALLVSAAINPIFGTPYIALLGRVMVVAALLLLTYSYAEQWHIKWLPRWQVQLLAVILAAPVATFLAYLISLSGDLHAFMSWPRLSGFLIISIVAMTFGPLLALGALFRERDAQLRAQALEFALAKEQLERQALDARLDLLQAQIEPHFLFNTLANVQELVETGSPRAGPVFKSLIAYLRASMPQLNHSHATLGNEIALVRAYLELMAMRMPDRLTVRYRLDPDLMPLRFPPMALLTLVENAVRHGIDPSVDGGEIEVGAEPVGKNGALRVWVADTGVGMAETASTGTGLGNLRQRLSALYGPTATLDFIEQHPCGLRAEMRFHPVD